jgi:AraC family transcriptional regulator
LSGKGYRPDGSSASYLHPGGVGHGTAAAFDKPFGRDFVGLQNSKNNQAPSPVIWYGDYVLVGAGCEPGPGKAGFRQAARAGDGTMKTVTLKDYKERMLRVLVHIQQRLDDPLTLAKLARLACFSPYHFHRIFKGMLGESVQEHIRRLRLERAAIQLKLSEASVINVAFDAGYETHEAFTRSFKAMFGLAPSRFRSDQRPLRWSRAPSGVHYHRGKKLQHFKTIQPGGVKMNVTIKTMPATRVAFMRHVGPYAEVGVTWDKLLPLMGKEGLLGGDTMFIGLCHDDPEVTPPDKIRYDACVTVDESFVPQGDIGRQVIPGGEYAVTTHFGPYNKLGETYAKLFGQWLPRSGREMGSTPCFEVYLNDPQSTAPADLLTDIYVPLKTR